MKFPRILRYFNFIHSKWILRIAIVSILVAIVWFFSRVEKPLCDKCNVILVSIDTLSALHLPCYGYGRNTAPNLCSFAEKNILFSNTYSQAPITLDSHFSIFTSLYPHSHNITRILQEPLEEKYLTLPQVFRLNGYQTMYHGILNEDHLPLNRGLERGFNFFEGDSTIDTWNQAYDRILKIADNKKPFFAFLHTYAVHSPYLTGHTKHPFTDRPEYPNIALTNTEYNSFSLEFFKYAALLILDRNNFYINATTNENDRKLAQELTTQTNFHDAFEIFQKITDRTKAHCIVQWNWDRIDKTDPRQVEYVKALYDERILQLDQKLKQLFDLLENPKLSKNTILIITSDHGEEFMEHGRFDHGANLYATSTRIPLIIHVPGLNAKKIKEMTQSIDIYPTVLSLTGLRPKSEIEGLDLIGLIRGIKGAPVNKYLLSEFKGMAGIQMGNLRYYYDKNTNSEELYDLTYDPTEQYNVAAREPKIVNKIKETITQ